MPFPDRINNINWHMNAISKGFKNNDLELVNLSYAKLIESIRQQNINDKNEFANHIEFVRNEYEEFRKDFGFEYPIQFLPPSERKKIAQTKDGKFILDSKTNFKLHLYNVEEENVKKIKKILDDEKTWNKENDLMPIFTLYNVKCSEVEDYIKKYKPIYDNYIINSIQKNADFSNYSEMDKADIIEEYKDEAINILEERADCDLKILFQESENPDEIDDELIKEYSFETISKYIGLQYYKDKIVTHWERKDFEDLIKADLAISGEQIEINEILLSLTLKNLNTICEKEENFFKRKNKAVEYLNENKELLKNVGKVISFRSIFKLKPLPSKFSNIKIEEISLSWAYVREYVKLIAETYKSSKRYTEEMKEDLDYVKFFKIESTEEYNVGVDFGFLNNRISGSIDGYIRNTRDLLMKRNLPINTGYEFTWQNVGKTRNSGIEIALNTVPVVTKDFRWTVQSDDGDRGRGGSREHSTVGKRCGRDRKRRKLCSKCDPWKHGCCDLRRSYG